MFYCIYRLYLRYTQKGVGWKTGDDKNGPKRRKTHCLGPSFSIAFVLFDTKQISIAYTGSKLRNTQHPKRLSHLELQVIHYHLTPLSSTGQAGARDTSHLDPR